MGERETDNANKESGDLKREEIEGMTVRVIENNHSNGWRERKTEETKIKY